MEDKVESLIREAISRKVFPGAVVLVGDRHKIEFLHAFGTTQYQDSGTKPVTRKSIYDIASLTKLFTYTAALKLLEKHRFELETPVSEIIPEFIGGHREKITIWNLFTHTSGLRLHMSSLKDFPSREIRHKLLTDRPFTKPGAAVYYTNINPMILAEIITRVTKKKFIDYLKEEILLPLRLKSTTYNPPKGLIPKIIPTEIDSWRTRLVHGEVHDESAFALGGISGHAGLFSTAEDLWRFAAMWLNGGAFGGKRILRDETVKLSTSRQVKSDNGWVGLGWKVDEPTLMDGAPPGTYGHTGFTGTSLVICPKRERIVILLSNWVYPRRSDPASLYDVRAKLAGITLES